MDRCGTHGVMNAESAYAMRWQLTVLKLTDNASQNMQATQITL